MEIWLDNVQLRCPRMEFLQFFSLFFCSFFAVLFCVSIFSLLLSHRAYEPHSWVSMTYVCIYFLLFYSISFGTPQFIGKIFVFFRPIGRPESSVMILKSHWKWTMELTFTSLPPRILHALFLEEDHIVGPDTLISSIHLHRLVSSLCQNCWGASLYSHRPQYEHFFSLVNDDVDYCSTFLS